MGDTTFDYVHGKSNRGSASPSTSIHQQQALAPLGNADTSTPLPPSDLHELFSRAGNAVEVLQSAIKTNINSPGESARWFRSTPASRLLTGSSGASCGESGEAQIAVWMRVAEKLHACRVRAKAQHHGGKRAEAERP